MVLFQTDPKVEAVLTSLKGNSPLTRRNRIMLQLHYYGCLTCQQLTKLTIDDFDPQRSLLGQMQLSKPLVAELKSYTRWRQPQSKSTTALFLMTGKAIDSALRQRIKQAGKLKRDLADVQRQLIVIAMRQGQTLAAIATCLGRKPADLYRWLVDAGDVVGEVWRGIPLPFLENDGRLPSLFRGQNRGHSELAEMTVRFILQQKKPTRYNYIQALKAFSHWCENNRIHLHQLEQRLLDLFRLDTKALHTVDKVDRLVSVARTWITMLKRERLVPAQSAALPSAIAKRLAVTSPAISELREQPRVVQILAQSPPTCLKQLGSPWVTECVCFLKTQFPNFARRRTVAHNLNPFFAWCDRHRLTLDQITFQHIKRFEATAHQHFEQGHIRTLIGACRSLFDWLVIHHRLPTTPVPSGNWRQYEATAYTNLKLLTSEQVGELLNACNDGTIVGLRNQAALSLLIFAFQTATTACKLKVQDYVLHHNRRWLNSYSVQGNGRHLIPVHPELAETMTTYLKVTNISHDPGSPLLLSVRGRSVKQAQAEGIKPCAISSMVTQYRARLGLPTWVNPRTLRLSGMLAYLLGGGSVDKACLLFGVDRIHRRLLASVGISLDGSELDGMLGSGTGDITAPLQRFIRSSQIFKLQPEDFEQ